MISQLYRIYNPILGDHKINIKELSFRCHIFMLAAFTTDDINTLESVAEHASDAQQRIIDNSANAHI